MTAREARDWVEWHRPYDEPGSRLALRLATVQKRIADALDGMTGDVRAISMCAGQGRDLLPVLARHGRRDRVRALLVELDERNAAMAEETAAANGLADRVEVLRADAALTDVYRHHVPANLILACGVFGNISLEDIERTVKHLPSLAAPGATAIWTRGWRKGDDVTGDIRRWFMEAGFAEVSFDAPQEHHYSVGVNRLETPPRPFAPGVRLFTFLR